MPKSGVVGGARLRHARRPPDELTNVVEGRISEICCDLAAQAKRLRQLQEQADELRAVIREWASQPEAGRVPRSG